MVAGMKTLALFTAAIATFAACKADSRERAMRLPDLSASLDGVRTEFNAHKHEARFLTLLAPT